MGSFCYCFTVSSRVVRLSVLLFWLVLAYKTNDWASPLLSEPCHKNMVFFVLRKLILQTHMRTHPVGLDVRFLVGPFVYFHTSCVRAAKALARLRGSAGSPEPSLVAYVIYHKLMSWLICQDIDCGQEIFYWSLSLFQHYLPPLKLYLLLSVSIMIFHSKP